MLIRIIILKMAIVKVTEKAKIIRPKIQKVARVILNNSIGYATIKN